jgi:hypothetical protein
MKRFIEKVRKSNEDLYDWDAIDEELEQLNKAMVSNIVVKNGEIKDLNQGFWKLERSR